jgi:hypothetical protein
MSSLEILLVKLDGGVKESTRHGANTHSITHQQLRRKSIPSLIQYVGLLLHLGCMLVSVQGCDWMDWFFICVQTQKVSNVLLHKRQCANVSVSVFMETIISHLPDVHTYHLLSSFDR